MLRESGLLRRMDEDLGYAISVGDEEFTGAVGESENEISGIRQCCG